MPVKIRLSRQGRKKLPIYQIVVADSRAPRDGKYIENIGRYNPKTNPASIDLNFDRALYWLQTGAQPSDTCRIILSSKGVMIKKHLLEGVKKGALTEEQANEKFQAWVGEKEKKALQKLEETKKSKEDLKKSRLAQESKVKDAKAAIYAKKRAESIVAESVASNDQNQEAEN